MKKIAVAGIAALALALTACGGAGGTTSPTASSLAPVTTISSTTATPTASATASSTTSTVAATTTTGAEVAENVDYPARVSVVKLLWGVRSLHSHHFRLTGTSPPVDHQGRKVLSKSGEPSRHSLVGFFDVSNVLVGVAVVPHLATSCVSCVGQLLPCPVVVKIGVVDP